MPNPHYEVPTGAINGTNTVFTVSQSYKSGSVAVFIRGILRQQADDDGWTETDSVAGTVTLKRAPLTDDRVTIFYLDLIANPLDTVLELEGTLEEESELSATIENETGLSATLCDELELSGTLETESDLDGDLVEETELSATIEVC